MTLSQFNAQPGLRVRVRPAFLNGSPEGVVLFYDGREDRVAVQMDEGGIVHKPPYHFEVH